MAIGEEKEIRVIKIGNEVKPSLFVHDMILYIEKPKRNYQEIIRANQ